MAAARSSEVSSPESSPLDFGFGFNNVNFSDRILRFDILPDLPRSEPDPVDSLGDCACYWKRLLTEPLYTANDSTEQSEEQIFNISMLFMEDGLISYENEEKVVAATKESPLHVEVTADQPYNLTGEEVAKDNEPSSSTEYFQVRTVHVSSIVLAARSPFFHKLFSNGMKESEQRLVTLQIQASEEDAVMDMLKFMYSNTLPKTTPTALLNVLLAADKFEVASCMKYCTQLLCNLPMTCESALSYLYLPSTVLMVDINHQLIDAAKKFIVDHFKDLSKNEDELLNMPFVAIEAVLSSDDLKVFSEDVVYDFVVKWAQLHYPKLKERREMLSNRLLQFVRFPYMTWSKLQQVLTCTEIESELASKAVLDALFFKTAPPYRQHSLMAEDGNALIRRFVRRSYKSLPVKVIEFELPRQHCVVYLDIKREECEQMFRVRSQPFHLGEYNFFLKLVCGTNKRKSCYYFEMFLRLLSKSSVGVTVDCEVAARMKDSEDFVTEDKNKLPFKGRKDPCCYYIFAIPWEEFMAEDSAYFVNGVAHLRVVITITE